MNIWYNFFNISHIYMYKIDYIYKISKKNNEVLL